MASHDHSAHEHHHSVHEHHDGTTRDPVCGMSVDPATAKHMTVFDGKRYYFCSANCLEKFEAHPEDYIKKSPAPENSPAGTKYTCPMHPEIVRDHPGNCPICGMALEPVTPTADREPNPELVDFNRRFRIMAPLVVAVFILEMSGHVGLPIAEWIGHKPFLWLQFLLTTPVLWLARPFFERGWKSVVNVSPNMWTLISLGTLAAYVFSLAGLFAPSVFPPEMLNAHGLPPVYFEAAAVILVLVLIGQIMELTARERT
ncbi:MAG TPA: heavy metal-binding domain-containing protein, partial [Paracoccaceae bacterium]|nr:heavy metal-binding domain-containing protein [Paracoccaceae bacterium]